MPSNREAYFQALKMNVPKAVINFALQEINGFDYFELTQKLDEEIKDYDSFVKAIERYINGEMIEYIFNKAYFLSIPLYVEQPTSFAKASASSFLDTSTDFLRLMPAASSNSL